MSTSVGGSLVLAVLGASLLASVEVQDTTRAGKPLFKKSKAGVDEPVMRSVALAEVAAHRIDLASHTLTVVTVQGRKVSGPLPKGWKPPVEVDAGAEEEKGPGTEEEKGPGTGGEKAGAKE